MSSPPPHLLNLNPEQIEAVTCINGPLLILAGAGSGKTRVLTRRVAHLLHNGVLPWQIMAVTFTNKAAAEMRVRVRDLVGDPGRHVLVSTFHSACVGFLRRDAPRLGYQRSFVIYDDDDQIRLLKTILKDLGMDRKRFPPRWYRQHIDQEKNALRGPEDLQKEVVQDAGWRLGEVYQRYQQHLKAANAMDFNDLVNNMVHLLEGDSQLRAEYQRRFKYLLVDEYQDTNHAQYRLILALAGGHHNLAVVGDDDQSIYSFRGADISNILNFEKDFPEARVVRLEKNYRSTANILAAASSMVCNNTHRKEKTLWTDTPAGQPVEVLVASDEDQEARRAVQRVVRLLSDGHQPGDVAFIYRTNSASRPLEQALTSAAIPYVVVGARKFYERREVRDLVAYLRLLANPTDDLAFLRIVNRPTRGIGARSIENIRARAQRDGVPLLEAARRMGGGTGRASKAIGRFCDLVDAMVTEVPSHPLGDMVLRLAERSDYLPRLRKEDTHEAADRVDNIQALARMAAQVMADSPGSEPWDQLRLFLDQASLSGQADELPDDRGKVTLLTAHLAKGLEFPVVFVVGMVEGNFPHTRSLDKQRDLEEERRLAYVAFTRARERLYLTRPQRRIIHQDGESRHVATRPSRFLTEIPDKVLRRSAPGLPPRLPAARAGGGQNAKMAAFLEQQRRRQAARSVKSPSRPQRAEIVPESLEAFQRGTRVQHPVYGVGIVVQEPRPGFNPKVLVKFTRFGVQDVPLRKGRLRIVLE